MISSQLAPQPRLSARNLSTALAVCDQLGLPLHPGKCVGPAPVLTVLGIELDCVNQVAHLPSEKLHSLWELIASWLSRTWCNRQELESIMQQKWYGLVAPSYVR